MEADAVIEDKSIELMVSESRSSGSGWGSGKAVCGLCSRPQARPGGRPRHRPHILPESQVRSHRKGCSPSLRL
ncbi:hypothetical protein chiPu_0031080 [Chiloscyllium punctatum]|uniref:Uncharacterized protein n=1 Tax=Chiloscyllium punctatum TaxID=137246 RepID=A0A401TWR5_CHIPU|nr:hypothetical protein [Chiloscyllium punctatum]